MVRVFEEASKNKKSRMEPLLGGREAIEQLLGRNELTPTRRPMLLVHRSGVNNTSETLKGEVLELLNGLLGGHGWVCRAFWRILVVKDARGGLESDRGLESVDHTKDE